MNKTQVSKMAVLVSLLMVGMYSNAASVATRVATPSVKPFGQAGTAVKPSASATSFENSIASLRSTSIPVVALQSGVLAGGLTNAQAIHGQIITGAQSQIEQQIKQIGSSDKKELLREYYSNLAVSLASLDGVPSLSKTVQCDDRCVVKFNAPSKIETNNLTSYFASNYSSISKNGLSESQQADMVNSMVAFLTGESLKASTWGNKESLNNALAILRDYNQNITRTSSRTDAWMMAMLKHIERMDRARGSNDRTDDMKQALTLLRQLIENCSAAS